MSNVLKGICLAVMHVCIICYHWMEDCVFAKCVISFCILSYFPGVLCWFLFCLLVLSNVLLLWILIYNTSSCYCRQMAGCWWESAVGGAVKEAAHWWSFLGWDAVCGGSPLLSFSTNHMKDFDLIVRQFRRTFAVIKVDILFIQIGN